MRIDIAEFKTPALIMSNLPKIAYGSGRQGAGFVDQFTELKDVRGKFKRFTGRRALQAGNFEFIQKYRYLIRSDVDITNALDKQLRFVIEGRTYSVESWEPIEEGRTLYLQFTLNLYGK